MCQRPICNHCLGRQFRYASTGLSNDERGKAVKTALTRTRPPFRKETRDASLLQEIAPSDAHAQKILSKENKAEIPDSEPSVEKCWVCLDIFKNLNFWADLAIEKLQGIEYETFLVGTKLSGLLSENEEILWEQAGTAYAEQLKSELNREIGKILSQKTKKEVAFSNPDIMVTFDIAEKKAELNIRSIYIYGRYQKKVRGIPQTKWPCRNCRGKGCDKCNGTGKQYKESVGELAGYPLWKASESEDVVFHGAGREDIDALMLGSGRPFVLEAKAPLIRTLDLKALKEEINKHGAGNRVSDLSYCGKDRVEKLKTEKAKKTYRLKIKFETPVTKNALENVLKELEGKEVNQNTPNRVMHRRADLCRNRTVHTAELERTETPETLKSRGSKSIADGGLYVKELTSSDEGKRCPACGASRNRRQSTNWMSSR